jgi:uncharacterized membrane protein
LAGHFGLEGVFLYVAAFAAGLIGAYLFSILAKRLMVGATSALGGIMFSVPLFILLLGPLGVLLAGCISIGLFIVVSIAGYCSQRGKVLKGVKKGKRRK